MQCALAGCQSELRRDIGRRLLLIDLDHLDLRFAGGLTQALQQGQRRRQAARGRRLDEGAKPVAAFDQALGGKIGQCPTNGDARHAKAVADRFLFRQGPGLRINAARNLISQDVEDLPMQRCTGHPAHNWDLLHLE